MNNLIVHSSIILFLILLLSCVMFFLRRKRNDIGKLVGFHYKLELITFNISCILLLGYLLVAKEDALWLVDSSKFGLLAIVGFLFLGFVAWVQTKTFRNIWDDIRHNYNVNFNLYLGLGSTLLLPLPLVSEYIGGKVMPFVMLAYLLCQLIQILVIFVRVLKVAGPLKATISVFTYIVGYITVIIQLFVLIFLYIGFLILKLGWLLVSSKKDKDEEDEMRQAEEHYYDQLRRGERGY